jgi:hypothetical protein
MMVLQDLENIGSQGKQKSFNACDSHAEGNDLNSSQATATVISADVSMGSPVIHANSETELFPLHDTLFVYKESFTINAFIGIRIN